MTLQKFQSRASWHFRQYRKLPKTITMRSHAIRFRLKSGKENARNGELIRLSNLAVSGRTETKKRD